MKTSAMASANQSELDDKLLDLNRWEAVVNRRPNQNESEFMYAVLTTGIYCRPGCPSKLASRENVRFYESAAAAELAGYRPCLRCKPNEESQLNSAIRDSCVFIANNLDSALTLDVLGKNVGLSPHHFHRLFRKAVGVTPRQYIAALRLKHFKTRLKDGEPIISAMIDAGYGSSRALYETVDANLGMTPTAYRNGGRTVAIDFATKETSLGWLLVAATSVGICAVTLGESESALEHALRAEFSGAKIERRESALHQSLEILVGSIERSEPTTGLPLDVRATAFQRLVWRELQSIPPGVTRSYSEVAASLGKPKAVRAVANACAANQVALAIPCHRVVRTDGAVGGYRWGALRKQELLKRERSHSKKRDADG